MKRFGKYLTFLVAVLLVFGMFFAVTSASAKPPVSTTTTTVAIDLSGYDLKTTSNADKSYDLCGGTLTLDFSNSHKTLDWTSTVPVEKVIYKSGSDYYVVNYPGGATSGHIDTSSDNSDFNQIYWYCLDEETTTTTEATTTTTEPETTTTTSEVTTTTTEEETTTTTEPETTTTTEEETTTTTLPETTTTTEQETTTTTQPETTTTTQPETTTTTQPVTTTTQPQTTTTEPEPTTVTLVQTDNGEVTNNTGMYVLAAFAGILFVAVILTSVFIPLVKRK